MVQWLKLHASNAGGTGLIPGQGTKILYALWRGRKKKEESFNISNKKGCRIHKSRTGLWGTSLAVQWLRLCASNAGGALDAGSNPSQGTKIPHVWPKKIIIKRIF